MYSLCYVGAEFSHLQNCRKNLKKKCVYICMQKQCGQGIDKIQDNETGGTCSATGGKSDG